MALSELIPESFEIHPIDIVESLAEHHDWEFDRVGDDQIAMAVEGQWRTYSITLAWSARDEMLRLICTFEMEPPDDRVAALYEALNSVNDQIWAGGFSFWAEQRLMVFRYGLLLSGGQIVGSEQIGRMITASVVSAERYYPAFQLVAWAGQSTEEAMHAAIAEAYGRA